MDHKKKDFVYSINDSMFALIIHFVGYNRTLDFYNQTFLKKQLATIQKHIKQFPPGNKEYVQLNGLKTMHVNAGKDGGKK